MMSIIVVDDEPLVRVVISQIIQNAAGGKYYVAAKAENGKSALQLIKHLMPDIVLTDVMMPGMDGLVLAQILRQQYPVIPVVMLSGYDDYKYIREALRQKVCDYIMKPVNPQDLMRVLDHAAEESKRRIDAVHKNDLYTLEKSGKLSRIYFCIKDNLFYAEMKAMIFDKIEKRLKDLFTELTQNATLDEIARVVFWIMSIFNDTYFPEKNDAKTLQVFVSNIFQCSSRNEIWNALAVNIRLCCEQKKHSYDELSMMEKLELFIGQNYARDLSLQYLADQFDLHPNYISNLFKKKFGKNYLDYLTEIRMSSAVEKLKATDMKISQIALSVGYRDPNYFYKVFKKSIGITPKELRKRMGKDE